MNSDTLPNLVTRNCYHYLVNRRGRRLATNAQATRTMHSTVIANFGLYNSIWLLLILFSAFSNSHAVQMSTNQTLDDPFQSSASISTTQCIIGRLRQCFDDEDCVENAGPQMPEVKVVITNKNFTEGLIHSSTFKSRSSQESDPNADRVGTCICRVARRCKRTQQSPKTVPIGERGRLADQRSKQSDHLGWIIGSLIALAIIGGCAFAIYYYGIRYGMIRNIARQLGLTDNTQVEHQLLNRIPSNADDEVELAI